MITLVTFLGGRVTQEDIPKGLRIQLTTCRRMVVKKPHTPKGFGRNEETRRGVCLLRTWVGRQLMRKAAVRIAFPQYDRGTRISKDRRRAISRRWRFLRSATPFC
ncbi:hypothetical protein CsSME_00026557 [Camellia sinensis var. sinensis]